MKNGEFAGSRGVWATMLHPDDKEKALGDITDFITHKTPHYNSSLSHAGKGQHLSVDTVQGHCGRPGGKTESPGRLVGTHLDITQRKEMEQRLQRSHAFLEQEVKKRTRDLIETNQKLETVLNSSSERHMGLRRRRQGDQYQQGIRTVAGGDRRRGGGKERYQPCGSGVHGPVRDHGSDRHPAPGQYDAIRCKGPGNTFW